MVEEYKSNSHKSKENPSSPVSKKIVTGNVKIQEKHGLAKVASLFIAEDVSDIKSYIIMDILIPTIRDTIVDIITKGTEMVFCGKNGRTRKPSSGSRMSYERYYEPSNNRRDYGRQNGAPSRNQEYQEIVFDTRGDAEMVLEQLRNYIVEYRVARVSDLYDFVEISSDNYTNCDYGWTDLSPSKAYVYRSRDGGYMLQLPRALPVD